MKGVIKKIYPRIPFKQRLFTAVKLFGTPSQSLYQHLHFEGDFSVRVDASHSFLVRHYGYELENTIFWEGIGGGWESAAIQVWTRLVKRSKVIFDVGANTGIYSLIAKCLNPDAEIHAFEPITRVYEKLLSNIRLNKFEIACHDFAASDVNGFAKIFDGPDDNPYSSTFHNEIFDEQPFVTVDVPVKRLDSFIRDHGMTQVDLIKLDIEGHEPAALAGMGNYLQQFRPLILIEILTDEIGNAVENLLEGNYVYFYINEDSGSIEQVEHLVRRKSFNYFLSPRVDAHSADDPFLSL